MVVLHIRIQKQREGSGVKQVYHLGGDWGLRPVSQLSPSGGCTGWGAAPGLAQELPCWGLQPLVPWQKDPFGSGELLSSGSP